MYDSCPLFIGDEFPLPTELQPQKRGNPLPLSFTLALAGSFACEHDHVARMMQDGVAKNTFALFKVSVNTLSDVWCTKHTYAYGTYPHYTCCGRTHHHYNTCIYYGCSTCMSYCHDACLYYIINACMCYNFDTSVHYSYILCMLYGNR